MKILFMQDTLGNAGAERSHLEIISRFSEEMDVGFAYFYPKHDLKTEYEGAGIRLFFLDIPESYHFPLAISRLVKLIRQEKPDLLVSCLWRADMITRIASWITGVPLVGTLVNDSYSPMAWKDKRGLKYKLVYWLDRLTAGIPIHWIANAQALAESHSRTLGLDRDKITVVYRGRQVPFPPRSVSSQTETNPRSVSPQTENSLSLHTEKYVYSKSGTITHFISYGRLLERKGFQDAIRAFAQVLPNHPHITLTIFGEGPYRKELEKLTQDLGLKDAVFLPGQIANPMEALISGNFPQPASTELIKSTVHRSRFTPHCFIFPSWYEGFSGALVEAMMAGIPIIASDIPMNLEAVEADESALTFPVGDTKALKEQMCYAIEHPDLMREYGNEARLVASKKFDIELIAKQYEGVLKGILSHH